MQIFISRRVNSFRFVIGRCLQQCTCASFVLNSGKFKNSMNFVFYSKTTKFGPIFDMEKPLCKYGKDCYRNNPSHFDLFSHPAEHVMGRRKVEDDPETNSKKSKLDDEFPTSSIEFKNSFNLYLSKVRGIDKIWNDSSMALDINDILKLDEDLFEKSAQFNYMVDIEWLMSKYPPTNRTKPLLIVTGGVNVEMRADAHRFQNIMLANARLEIAYGTHHTKMMILKYSHGLRVVIHTANLIENDWDQKTQGIWLSPLFPKLPTNAALTDSATGFKNDLSDYLKSYKLKQLDFLIADLNSYDFTDAKVFLIGSTPGRHLGPNLNKWGHLKLRSLLKSNCNETEIDKTWPLLGQFSSIGSLGASPDNWLLGEFRSSLSASDQPLVAPPQFHLVYPTVENVRTSLEGYQGGGSLPYSIDTARKQPYLKNYLHQWKSLRTGRTRACPHIKTFTRVNSSFQKLAWFLITSSNLSKAAWGSFEKNNSQLMIRSYELGVLFLPKYFGLTSFPLESKSGEEKFPFPYDLPPVSYSSNDEPWIVNVPYKNKSDSHGNFWDPR